MEALGINLGYLLVQIFNFAILFVVLRAWVFKPIVGVLEKRRETIAQGIEDARIAAKARANAEEEAEKIMAQAQQEAGQVIREATGRGEQVQKEIKEAAEAEAVSTREAARAEADQTKDRVLGDLRGQVAALAISAAQKIIGEALDEKRQHALIEEFFSGVKKGKVVLLAGESISGASAEVTSALPLTKAEQDSVKKDVTDKIGDSAPISFRVDPSILGGLIIRVGDKVLDGSVAGKLDNLRQTLR
ncbi:MAG: F0F1 ATP synthase subunit B [Anaerolineales bacterium]|nr:MAG: F0F1 ATP synthase subunit B [Anaerolineales bacterium]